MSTTDLAALKATAKESSIATTVLAIVAAVAGLGVGLGIFGANVEGIIIAATADGVVVVGLVVKAVHTGTIEPSGTLTAVLAFVGQAVALLVAFGLITDATASHVVAIVSAVVIAGLAVAHALLDRTVATKIARTGGVTSIALDQSWDSGWLQERCRHCGDVLPDPALGIMVAGVPGLGTMHIECAENLTLRERVWSWLYGRFAPKPRAVVEGQAVFL